MSNLLIDRYVPEDPFIWVARVPGCLGTVTWEWTWTPDGENVCLVPHEPTVLPAGRQVAVTAYYPETGDQWVQTGTLSLVATVTNGEDVVVHDPILLVIGPAEPIVELSVGWFDGEGYTLQEEVTVIGQDEGPWVARVNDLREGCTVEWAVDWEGEGDAPTVEYSGDQNEFATANLVT
jgi:hypothetical protein